MAHYFIISRRVYLVKGRKRNECKGSCEKELHPDTFRGSSEREVAPAGRGDVYIVWLRVTPPASPVLQRASRSSCSPMSFLMACPKERADKNEHGRESCHNSHVIYPKTLGLGEIFFSFFFFFFFFSFFLNKLNEIKCD